MYEVRKTYNHSIGLSATFRQWAATSHCRFIHGYSLKVVLVFRGFDSDLDHRNWLVDFGGLKEVKKYLEDTFDHKMLVARDDPHYDLMKQLHAAGIIDMVEVKATGCEAFARKIYDDLVIYGRVPEFQYKSRLARVEIHEHDGNMAAFERQHV